MNIPANRHGGVGALFRLRVVRDDKSRRTRSIFTRCSRYASYDAGESKIVNEKRTHVKTCQSRQCYVASIMATIRVGAFTVTGVRWLTATAPIIMRMR